MAITSGNARMMMMADLTNHTGVFLRNPDWHVLFDMNPEAAAQTRRRMADLVIKEKMQVAFYHAPFPSTGFIEKAGNGYRLEPVQWSCRRSKAGGGDRRPLPKPNFPMTPSRAMTCAEPRRAQRLNSDGKNHEHSRASGQGTLSPIWRPDRSGLSRILSG
jgi:hypothetical protein